MGPEMARAAVTLQQRRVTDTLSCFQEASVKKIVLAIAVVIASAAVASAQTAATKPAHQAKPAAKTAEHKAEKAAPMKAEVVSTDAAAKTITVKDASGANVTLTATGSAVAELSKVKAGDMVMVTKSENNATKITKVKTTEAHPKEKK
jgi:ribosomal protein L12E/L44/L45/RPP1/RPP2